MASRRRKFWPDPWHLVCCIFLNSGRFRSEVIKMDDLSAIEIGYQVYLKEGGEPCGAVRAVAAGGRSEIIVYIENAGEFVVPASAVRAAHDAKVILDRQQLDQPLLDAIAHAHDREVPGL